jgi:hypothetical protein
VQSRSDTDKDLFCRRGDGFAIRLILPKLAAAHPEVILLAGMFRSCQV